MDTVDVTLCSYVYTSDFQLLLIVHNYYGDRHALAMAAGLLLLGCFAVAPRRGGAALTRRSGEALLRRSTWRRGGTGDAAMGAGGTDKGDLG